MDEISGQQDREDAGDEPVENETLDVTSSGGIMISIRSARTDQPGTE